MTTPEELRRLLSEPEGVRLECKEAKRRYDFGELADYCVALANGGGGKIVLGITDQRPRSVVGTAAFSEPGRAEAGLTERLGHTIPVEELNLDGRRVLLFHVPGRVPGEAWSHRGRYWARAGDGLVPMTDEQLRRIHAEAAPDWSAEPCAGAVLADLDGNAIRDFRWRWARRDQKPRTETWSDEETLRAAELLVDGHVTNAAVVLFGGESAVGRLIPQAEIIFEYRSSEAAGPAQDRAQHRAGFLLVQEALWDRINLRNERQSFQDGLFRTEIPTFDEGIIREAVLNAVCHRDYRLSGSVFVRQHAGALDVDNPGGFPQGVTAENLLDEHVPRNRRLAEALARCGLVERSGQGVNLMFERSIRQSKPLPDYSRTVAHSVRLTLRGVVTNPAFLRFLERVGEQTLLGFDTRDLLVLDRLQRDEPVPDALRPRLPRLVQLGLVESHGRGRGTRYLLSRGLYSAAGQPGAYTRRRGLDRETNKLLLLQHVQDAGTAGAPMAELLQVLHSHSRAQVKRLLDELRAEGRVILRGARRAARWHAPGRPDRARTP